jgi:eukaryotic-like serine/threonine-protein kinase
MESKIFLDKYRVSLDELESPGELRDHPLLLEAEDIVAEKKVSLELVPAASLKPAVLEKLEAEAAAAKKLNHINIPALLDFGIEEDQLVYVTEYVDGTSAEEWVNSHGPMPTGAVLRIGLQVVSALGAAAFQKISHHAINPGNLILVPGQTAEGDWPLVKVLHFVGVAPTSIDTHEGVAAFDRSTHYASPEQLKQGLVDFRSEIYSLGCTMWFLLTGAPPLMVAKGPVALHQTNIGLAVDKLHGMPKRVRRLLAQILSIDREARPHDPLGFYRQIQECLAQVDRRETMARRFGVPLLSRTRMFRNPAHRRVPMKALALAAILLTISAVAAFVLPAYLHHKRVIQAEEPIGVPIGVPDASGSATPAATANAVVQNQTQPPNATVDSAKTETIPTDSAAVASRNDVAPPVQPGPVAPNETQTAPPAVAQAPPAPAPETRAIAPESKPAETTAPAPRTESAPVISKTKTDAATTQDEPLSARAVAPEVRRAEPAPPSEGPEDAAVASSRIEKPKDAEPKVSRKSRSKKSQKSPHKSQDEMEIDEAEREASMPPVPRGSMRAKFVGVTADGQWMLMLPSHKVVVVPPPRSYP